jgi:hypothetical protein
MYKYFLFVLCFIPKNLTSQTTDFQSGLLPSVTIGHSPVRDLKFTAKLESVHPMQTLNEEGNNVIDYSYKRTDIQVFLGHKINPFWSFAGGYQFRFNNSEPNSQRFIQQLAYVQPGVSIRFGHRLRTDQTISKTDPYRLRVRYRFSSELALQGKEVDIREFYLTISEEIIYIHQRDRQDFENRVIASLGYYLNDSHRIEIGPDFRIKNFRKEHFQYRLWLNIGWRLRI